MAAEVGGRSESSQQPEEIYVKLCWDCGQTTARADNSVASSGAACAETGRASGGNATAPNRSALGEVELSKRVEELEATLAAKDAEIAMQRTELDVASRLIERRKLRVEALKKELDEARKDARAQLTKKDLLIESLQADLEELLDGKGGKFWFELADSHSDSGDECWPPAPGANVRFPGTARHETARHTPDTFMIRCQPYQLVSST
jgi:hypothetical protein